MFTLTGAILTKIAPAIKEPIATMIADWHTKVCPMYGIDSADILHEFLANELHESNIFTNLSESLNYQTVALSRLFSSSRITPDEIYKYGRRRMDDGTIKPADQKAIANCIYGREWGRKNLGNTKPNDGWNMRGAGPIQNTGRANIGAFAAYYNKLMGASHTVDEIAALLRTDIGIGIHSACWFFAISKKLIPAANNDQFNFIVKKINGAYFGMPERVAYYELAKRYIVN